MTSIDSLSSQSLKAVATFELCPKKHIFKIIFGPYSINLMVTQYPIQHARLIETSVENLWEALTNPAIVKRYFFGTDLVTSWEVGSPIVFKGEWENQGYEDKGTILAYEPRVKLAFSYLSNWSGKDDVPENYLFVQYEVEAVGPHTRLTITQTNYDEERAQHSEQNWASVVDELIKVVA